MQGLCKEYQEVRLRIYKLGILCLVSKYEFHSVDKKKIEG